MTIICFCHVNGMHGEVPDREVTHDRVLTGGVAHRYCRFSPFDHYIARKTAVYRMCIPFMPIVHSHHTVWYFKPWMPSASYKAIFRLFSDVQRRIIILLQIKTQFKKLILPSVKSIVLQMNKLYCIGWENR